MDRNSLLSCDDENSELKEFYERHHEFLVQCSVNYVPPHVLRNVAVKLHSTLLFDSDWQEYASKMEITDNLLLAKIQQSAKWSKELPLYITMTSSMQHINGKLIHVIKALLNTKRFDVLKYLKPYVKELVERCSGTEVKGFISSKEQLSCTRSKNLDLSSAQDIICETVCSNSNNVEKSEKACTIELDPALLERYTACEFEPVQQSSQNGNHTSEVQLHSSSNLSEFSCKEDTSQVRPFPSAPSEEMLSVFIQHTEFDIEVARQLAANMKEEGIRVTALYDMDKLILIDSIGALRTVFQEVDFIVPIVSKKFLRQIHPQNFEKYLESMDAMNNRTLYQLIMNEYRNNSCVNFRVRPVIVPDMTRRLLINDVILSYSFRLWNEVPKLIRILRETKELIPQYPFH